MEVDSTLNVCVVPDDANLALGDLYSLRRLGWQVSHVGSPLVESLLGWPEVNPTFHLGIIADNANLTV